MMKIPFGNVMSYKQIAVKINNPQAYRAVGTANAKNTIPVIIPCHRVIANNGTLGGYGGGLKDKKISSEDGRCHLTSYYVAND